MSRLAPLALALAAASGLAAPPAPAAALVQAEEVSVRVSLSQREVAVGATVMWEIAAATWGRQTAEVTVPDLPAGLAEAGRSRSSSFDVSLPGGVRRVARTVVVVQALEPGEYRLGPPVATFRGERIRGEAVILRVVAAPANPASQDAPGASPPVDAVDDVVVTTRLSLDSVYAGQPLTLTGQALLSDQARRQLRSVPQYYPPNPEGFLIHDFPPSGREMTTSAAGRRYEAQTFRRVLVPLEPGTMVIPPARLEVELRRGIFDPLIPRVAESRPIRLEVLPLPAAGRPAGYRGAVGSYRVRAVLEPAATVVGEEVVLTLEVEGAGYLKLLPRPELPALAGASPSHAGERSEVGWTGGRPAGVKRFSWVIAPERAGTLRIPEIEYPYFDPERREYVVARTRPLLLEVGELPPGVAMGGGGQVVRPLKSEPSPAGRLAFVRSGWFGALQLLPLVGVLLAWGYGRRSSRGALLPRRTLRRARASVLERIAAADSAAGRDPGALARELRRWCAIRLGAPAVEEASADLLGALVQAGAEPADAAGLTALIGELERARYTPTPPDGRWWSEATSRARELVLAVDRALRRPRAPAPTAPVDAGRRVAGVLGLVGAIAAAGLLALATVSPASPGDPAATVPERQAMTGTDRQAAAVPDGQAASDADRPERAGPARLFHRAAERFEAGEAEVAASELRAYLAGSPRDPAGWYNLGVVGHALGDRGLAVRSWIQAARLAPRDQDARANLLAVGASLPLLRAALPALPLSLEERLLLASALWLALAASLGSLVLTRGRGWVVVGALALVLAAALAVDPALRRARPPVAVVAPISAALHSAPVWTATELGAVRGGDGVRILERRDGWSRVAGLGRGGNAGFEDRGARGPSGPGRPDGPAEPRGGGATDRAAPEGWLPPGAARLPGTLP